MPHLDSLTDQLRSPARLAIAPDGTVLVADPPRKQIVRFDNSGGLLSVWSTPAEPIGVAVHPDGRIFVSLRDEAKVAVYDSAFDFLEYLGAGDPLVSFVGPTDIDIATDTGRIYVVDAKGDKIYGFESDGSLALVLGSRGSWPGEFIYPSAITIDEPRNRIIIADHDKNRIHLFTTGGVFLQQFGDRLKSTNGTLEGWMPRPLGLVVDASGNIYVTDGLMGTVRVFDSMGTELGKVVDYGHEPGGLRVPCDVALSSDESRLYVASVNGARVETYDVTGTARAAGDSETVATSAAEGAPAGLSGDEFALGGVAETRETRWDGPHIVEDRPDLCGPCHGITGQPGTHAGTVEGQGVMCMSCHNAGGRALDVTIHENDVADPFGTNELAADGHGRSHAWGVPAVNPLADAVGPAPYGVMGWHLDPEGNIKCATCHNQHNMDYGTSYLRVNNDGDAMCKECHAPRDRGLGEGGSHPVGVAYPEGEGEYPASGDIPTWPIMNGLVECTTCHALHGADSGGANDGAGDGMLLRASNDESHCRACHTEHAIHDVEGDWQPTCRDCHDIHDAASTNDTLIAREIDETPVTFLENNEDCGGQRDFIHSTCDTVSYDGVCEACHTTTDHHRNSSDGDHAHNAGWECTLCHVHSTGFLPSCSECHEGPPDGTVSPNQAGSHAIHFAAVTGPSVPDCNGCHAPYDGIMHDNGAVSFASGVDANFDGNIDLAEADVCDTCHSVGGTFDGVEDPVIGAKANWADGVYDGDVLKAGKQDWCLGCHDDVPAVVHDIAAPALAGDNDTWGYNIAGHGRDQVWCTDCHDPALPHQDGVARTFSLRFPLSPAAGPKSPEERELDRDAYNDGYRLRSINSGRALAVPRDAGDYVVEDFALCFSCHDELKILGVPENYGLWYAPSVPAHLQLPAGVAQTNYRNEYEWGYAWGWYGGKPANIHWNHTGLDSYRWDVDHDGTFEDSCHSCVTCHNPHGVRGFDGASTVARMMADVALSFGIYNDGIADREYGYIGSGDFMEPGGDLNCDACHSLIGPGSDPPFPNVFPRYYRDRLDLSHEEPLAGYDGDSQSEDTPLAQFERAPSSDGGPAGPAAGIKRNNMQGGRR